LSIAKCFFLETFLLGVHNFRTNKTNQTSTNK
jgi:hypothetical protein